MLSVLSASAWAVEITADLARKIVDANDKNDEAGHAYIISQFDRMTDDEMMRLREMIEIDMHGSAGKIVANLPIDHRFANRVLNMIDDRLGMLKYDVVLEGHFAEGAGAGHSITWYSFETNGGHLYETEVFVGPSTLYPYLGYWENYYDIVRIYVDTKFKLVRKIELVCEVKIINGEKLQ